MWCYLVVNVGFKALIDEETVYNDRGQCISLFAIALLYADIQGSFC